MKNEPRHQCLIYEGDPSRKLGVLAGILQRKLEEGYRCLYLNSPPMVTKMRSTLTAFGVDVTRETATTRLILSSDPVTENGIFDSDAMLLQLEETINQAVNDGYKGLWASGDMSWEFGPTQDFSKLMEYEFGLEKLFHKRKELCGICQYHHDTLPRDVMRQGLLVHSHVLVNETLSHINPHYLKSAWPPDQITNDELDEMIASLFREDAI